MKRFRIPPHIWFKCYIIMFLSAIALLILAFACYTSGQYSEEFIMFLIITAAILMVLSSIGEIIFWRCPKCGAPLKRPFMRNIVRNCYYCGAKFENLKLVEDNKDKNKSQ